MLESLWAIGATGPAGTYLQHQGLDLKVLNFNGHSALHKADNLQKGDRTW